MNKTFTLLTSCLTVIFSLAFTFCVFSAEIHTEALAGVSTEYAMQIQQAADTTTALFARSGLSLEQPVTILLTPDRNSFIAEVTARFHINEFEAQRVAKGADALSGGHLTVINISGIPSARQKLFLTAHELTHHYQRQIAGNQASEIMWLLEGMADTLGAQAVDHEGYFSLNQYQHNWQTGLQMIAPKPSLCELETKADWSHSISSYGSTVTYKTAALAVLYLTKQFGEEKILDYFRSLGQGDSADAAFQNVFGMSIREYEDQYLYSLRKAS
jgi:hypothetical protein